MMWLAVECKRAYMVRYYNSSKICYCHHFELFFFFLPFFLFYWIKLILNVCILILCLLVVDLT